MIEILMKVTKYKDNYGLIPNFVAVRQHGKYIFLFDCYSYPLNKKLYNTGIWKIKYKNLKHENVL